jgi:hypothetical protein
VRANGMTYDTGFIRDGQISRESSDPAVVRRELAIIRDDLHCNAVQVIGGDPERLELAGRCAAELGLEVWFSPYPLELAPAGILALFTDCAERAERLRAGGAEVVFVAGVELSIMNREFMPGGTVDERLELLLGDPDRRAAKLAEVRARLGDFLRTAVAAVRRRFGGRVTYAAIPFEVTDWTPFDIVSVELIRSAEGVDSAFVFLFALDGFPHRPDGDPRYDLDLASPGIVKVLEDRRGGTYPDMAWEPKAAFTAVARCYRS